MQRTDIIEDFQRYSSQLNWVFSYGNKANQNLLQSDLDKEKIYLILDPVTRTKTFSEFGGFAGISFSGSFILVVKSTIDQTYYGQTEEERFVNRASTLDQSFNVENNCLDTQYRAGKYNENIKPLIELQISDLENIFNCSDYKIDEWRITDVTDIFDANLDGIIVNFRISTL
tara:strand:- start:27204 stop:27719 length:516 start_codon:yes stop_codon:yes gene_type:complete